MVKSMSKAASKAPSFQAASARLPGEMSKREALLSAFHTAHADYHAAHDHLTACHQAMARTKSELEKNQAVIDRLRAVVDAGPGRPAPELRQADAPLMTDAEFYHQREINPEIENPAKSTALFSMDEYIGGFSRFTARKDYQEIAAARFLSLYERSQLGGAKANDLSQPFVDRSGQSASDVESAGMDARRQYDEMAVSLGKANTSLLERIIVGRVSARMIAAQRTGKTAAKVHGKAIAQVAQELWNAMDLLTTHFQLTAVGHKSTRPARAGNK